MTDLLISKRGAMELLAHEGAVLEAYKDSVGVWTWGIGITNASGHEVFPRYRKNPQSLEKVIEVFLWALKKYQDDVIKAFHPVNLNEHQLAAATSFHYNTGGIFKATWVKQFKAGDVAKAKKSFMQWRKPSEIMPRRRAERDLFFDAKWLNPTKIVVWDVHTNGNVNWNKSSSVDARSALDAAWPASTPKPPEKPVQRDPALTPSKPPEKPETKPSTLSALLTAIFNLLRR